MTTRNIDELRKLSALKKSLYANSLQDKIGRDNTQFQLKETFRPLLAGQESQLKETKNIVQKQIETAQQNELIEQQKEATKQLQHRELIAEIKRQPLIIPLIKSLADFPEVIKVIMGESDGRNLTGQEQGVLRELGHVDDRILRLLIKYYMDKPDEDVAAKPLLPPPVVSMESHPADIAAKVDAPPVYKENEFESSNRDTVPYKKTYDDLKLRKNLRDNLGFYLDKKVIRIRDHPVLFSPDNRIKLLDSDRVYTYTSGLHKLLSVPQLNVLAKSNNDITKDDVQSFLDIIQESGSDLTTMTPDYVSSKLGIKLNTALQKIGKLNSYYATATAYNPYNSPPAVQPRKVTSAPQSGKGVAFLSSDPNELFKKLNILIAEKEAGHTNILSEASAIVDELRRLGLLTISQIKKIHKLITK